METHKMTTNEPSEMAADLLWGTPEIARELGFPLRRVLHLIDAKILPTEKIGGRVVASRKRLRAFLEAAVAG